MLTGDVLTRPVGLALREPAGVRNEDLAGGMAVCTMRTCKSKFFCCLLPLEMYLGFMQAVKQVQSPVGSQPGGYIRAPRGSRPAAHKRLPGRLCCSQDSQQSRDWGTSEWDAEVPDWGADVFQGPAYAEGEEPWFEVKMLCRCRHPLLVPCLCAAHKPVRTMQGEALGDNPAFNAIAAILALFLAWAFGNVLMRLGVVAFALVSAAFRYSFVAIFLIILVVFLAG